MHPNQLDMDALEDLMSLGKYRDHQVEMLTLSACQTALGNERAALGLGGAPQGPWAMAFGQGAIPFSCKFKYDYLINFIAIFFVKEAFFAHFEVPLLLSYSFCSTVDIIP